MLRHTGSARDPLPTGGYSDDEPRRRSPAGWAVLALAIVAIGMAVVAVGGGFTGSGVSSQIAGAFSSKG